MEAHFMVVGLDIEWCVYEGLLGFPRPRLFDFFVPNQPFFGSVFSFDTVLVDDACVNYKAKTAPMTVYLL